MKRIISIFLLVFFTVCFSNNDAIAQKSKSYKPKTVKVKSYTTKKGKTVRSYYRSKPSRRRTSRILFEVLPVVTNSIARNSEHKMFISS